MTEQIPNVHGAELGLNIGQKETKHIYIHKRLLDASILHATRKCQYGSALSELNKQNAKYKYHQLQTTQKPNKTSEKSLGKIMKLGNKEKYVKLCSCHILHF